MSQNKKYKAGIGLKSVKVTVVHASCNQCGWIRIADQCARISACWGAKDDFEELFCPDCGIDDIHCKEEVFWKGDLDD